jgi:hypothetical protein
MKNAKWLLILSFWFVVGFSGGAYPYTYYVMPLGSAAAAKDIWFFSCLNPNTKSVHLQIRRIAGNPCVKAALVGTALSATSCSTVFSSLQRISTGAGNKVLTIYKNPAVSGTVSYQVNAKCFDNTGVFNPADQAGPFYLQNQ